MTAAAVGRAMVRLLFDKTTERARIVEIDQVGGFDRSRLGPINCCECTRIR